MINTSSYSKIDFKKYSACSISRDKGKDAGFEGIYYPDLAPKKEFWRIWKDNRGKISEEENNRYYIEEYYKQVLSKLDPDVVYKELGEAILLCYEDSSEFCHRHIVAAWFNLLLGNSIEPVTDISIVDDNVEVVDAASRYMDILEDVIRSNEKMCGFTSVRARYLFDKGEQLEELADKKELENQGMCFDSLRQSAYYYKCDAYEVEAKYKAAQYRKVDSNFW